MKKIVIIICHCLAFATLGYSQVPFECVGQTYMTLERDGLSQLTLVEFNQAGTVNLNAVFSNLNISINSVGYRSTDNLIYGLDMETRELARIDALGNVERLASLALNNGVAYLGADITPDGNFLVLIGGIGDAGNGVDLELAKVNLNDPNYGVTTVNLSGPVTRSFDIAYDPLDGQLYGFDSNARRLYLIDDNTGVITTPFPQSDALQFAGALFFNAFGDLFAYGAQTPNSGQNTLISINKQTGAFKVLTTGDVASNSDGCSCPYTVEITKTVNALSAFPCSQVEYTFAIANSSFATNSNAAFEDEMPNGFKILEVLSNPFGGNVIMSADSSMIFIEDMSIPPGVDSIKLRVEIGEVPLGVYKNQAMLTNLPAVLGGSRVSDDPRTLFKGDSTSIIVDEIPFDSAFLDQVLCVGDELELDVSLYGSRYLWQDGSTQPNFLVEGAGTYFVTVSSACDTVYLEYEIRESEISVDIDISETFVVLGDSVDLSSDVFNSGNITNYSWQSSSRAGFECTVCPDPSVQAIENTTFFLTVSNEDGCTDMASVSLEVEADFTIFIPNVFTPNRDDINDYLEVFSRSPGELLIFDIFDRWGNKVFSAPPGFMAEGLDQRWNGEFRGSPMNPGVYAYVAKIRFVDGTERVVHGNVTLLR